MCRFLIFMVSVFIISISSTAHAETETMTVNVCHAFLRETPKSDGAAIGAVKMGDKLEILQKAKKWVKVRLADGRTGYVWHKLLVDVKGKPLQTGLKHDAKTDAKSELKAEAKGQKPVVDGPKSIPQNLAKATKPAAKPVPTQPPVATAVKSPAPAPMVPAPAAAINAVASGKTTPAAVVAPVQSAAAASVIPAPAPEHKAILSGKTTPAPTPVVATVATTPPEEATADHSEDVHAAEEIAKKDEELAKLHWEFSKLTQEKDALRAKLRQYKLAEAADKNSEKVYLSGVGEVEMVAGSGITTFKVPLSIESKADQVFTATRPDKLVRDGYAYYSAPSTAFK